MLVGVFLQFFLPGQVIPYLVLEIGLQSNMCFYSILSQKKLRDFFIHVPTVLFENCIKVSINKDSTWLNIKNLSVALISIKQWKSSSLNFTALILKYQEFTIKYTAATYEFILPIMNIVCGSLPCSSYTVTYYHLQVPIGGQVNAKL